ncbi:retrovirus-related pol polyprotein from transposon TNT 1-94 [Tanacetum coccineum]
MSSNSDDIQSAGSDTRPPILDRTDYESWSQRPFELGTTRDTLGTTPEGGVLLGPERPRLPKDIYKLINHNIEAKAIWDNVKMLLAGSELTKEDRESQLYDEFERFRMLPGENINEYYVRFHKLVNDMRNIRMTMPNIQLNSKFVNNMSPEWDRFVTAVKLNKGLKETNHEQLYAYLKQHEKHAAQDRLIIERITPSTNDPLAFVSSVQPYSQPSQSQSHQYQSSTTPPQSQNVQSIPYSQFAESSSPDSGYTQTEEILNTLSKQFALLTQSFRATLPQTNNQLRTSSNTRNQATIQDGQIVVQNVQGRQNQNQRNFARGNGAAGFGGMQNRAGNANAGQGKPVKCYNCNGVGHIARNCTQLKRPQNSDYFKDKMLLMQAQENGAVLDEEELLFLAGEQGNTFDADVDNQPVQDLALNEDNIFQADECDAFNSDVDDEPAAQTIFMANLSSARSANPQAVQESNVIDSTSVYMGNSNVIPYEQYLSVNNISVVPSCASSTLNNVCVTSDNDAFVPRDPIANELKIYKQQVVIYKQRAKFELTEREQRMDDQMQLLKTHHVPVNVPSFEEELELAEATRNKLHMKMNDSTYVEKRVNITPPNYSKEIFMETFTPQTQLTPEQVFWSLDLEKQKAKELKANAPPLPVLPPATVFENLEAEVDQNEIDLKSGEIERKNLLITNDNLIAECLSKDVFYTATDSVLNVSRFSDMHDAFTIARKHIADLESENFNLRNKIQNDDHDSMIKHFSKLEVEHFNLQLKYQNLKERFGNKKPVTSSEAPSFDSLFLIGKLNEQIQNNSKCATIPDNKPKVLDPGRYPIDVEPIPPKLKKNREVHLHYIKHLKENVETLHEIVKEAKARVLKTLALSINKMPLPIHLRKSELLLSKTSTHNTPPQVEHQKINSTNAPRIPSIGVNGASAASKEKTRSNTKKDRTLPAKSVLKQVEAHSRMNKSNEKQKNRVGSSISYKHTIINSNSNTSCKTCNKCLISVNHDQCVVHSEIFVKQSPATKWPLTRNTPPTVLPTKQWKPTGRLLPLGRQCPLVRSTALKSDCMPADPQETIAPVAYNLACTN